MDEREIHLEQLVESEAVNAGSDALVGATLGGHLKIISCVGSGGMSVVYKAEDLLLKRTVAVKILHSHSALNPQNVLRFRQEAMAASKIDHANVIRIFEFSVPEKGQPYLVMDFIAGQSLADFIASNGPIEMRRAVSLMGIICDGLQCAHDAGVVHRDLKPANIMLLKDASGKQTLKLVDFGIAKVLTEDSSGHALTQTGEVFGSPLYMSPEQCYGKTLDRRSDLYSLGCVMYEMCTGQPPIKGGSLLETIQLQTTDMPASASSKYSGIKYGAEFDLFIQRAMAKSPDERFQSASEFKQALLSMLELRLRDDAERKQPQLSRLLLAAACIVSLTLAATFWNFKNPNTGTASTQPSTSNLPPAKVQTSQLEQSLLSRRFVSDAALTAFYKGAGQNQGHNQVDQLMLQRSRISDRGLEAIARDTRLIAINCSSSAISDGAGQVISTLPNLETLEVSNNRIGDQFFKSFSSLKNLSLLSCSKTKITNSGLAYLSGVPLRELNLTGTRVDSAGMDALAKMPLRKLILSYTKVGNDGLAALSKTQIEDLRIIQASITGDGLKHLQNLHSMNRLHAGNNHLGGYGRPYFKNLTSLQFLDLENTGLTDDDVKEIASLTNLDNLSLKKNELTEKSLQYVSKLPHLKLLRIVDCHIPADAIEAYKREHPAVDVTLYDKKDTLN